jgi:hypothetical protein
MRQLMAVQNPVIMMSKYRQEDGHIGVHYSFEQVWRSLCHNDMMVPLDYVDDSPYRTPTPLSERGKKLCRQCQKAKALLLGRFEEHPDEQRERETPLSEYVRDSLRSTRVAAYERHLLDLATRTNENFKPGDHVYVIPDTNTRDYYRQHEPNSKKTKEKLHYIRATVTDLDENNQGYNLRAFAADCRGIYMFNQWDRDLIPREGKLKTLVPDDYSKPRLWCDEIF